MKRSRHFLRPIFVFAAFCVSGCAAHHVIQKASETAYPVFVSQIPNPNDYSLFANNGWDGNWYVGYNNGWIKKLPAIPKGPYAHAYLGAKLGRMKVLPPTGRPPRFDPVPGEIWMAISSTPAWPAPARVRLTGTEDIPLDGSAEYALENTGESEWFWTEIPLTAVNVSGDNYVALWSPTPALISVSSAPVLASGWGGKDVNTWLAKNIKGEPPADPKAALATGISVFQPAIALKLIPAGLSPAVHIRMVSWQSGTPDHLKPIITVSVEGDSVERVWIEQIKTHRRGDVVGRGWTQIGRSLWKAPYVFTLDQELFQSGQVKLRAAASNIWGETGATNPIELEVSPVNAKK